MKFTIITLLAVLLTTACQKEITGSVNGLSSINIAYYKMDESSETVVDSKNAHNSTSTTGITYSATGKLNTALSTTDVTGNGIDFGEINAFDLTTGSISLWVNFHTGAWLLSNMDNDNDRNGFSVLRSFSTPNNFFTVMLASGSAVQSVNSSAISLDTWYHLVVTWNGTTVQIYLNGTLDQSVSQTVTPTYTTFPFRLFTTTGSEGVTKKAPMYGTLDEIGIFNAVLTSTQVTTLYNSGTPLAFSSFD